MYTLVCTHPHVHTHVYMGFAWHWVLAFEARAMPKQIR